MSIMLIKTNNFASVSDSCFSGQAQDKSGPNLESILISSGIEPTPKVTTKCVVPDEELIIQVPYINILTRIKLLSTETLMAIVMEFPNILFR